MLVIFPQMDDDFGEEEGSDEEDMDEEDDDDDDSDDSDDEVPSQLHKLYNNMFI